MKFALNGIGKAIAPIALLLCAAAACAESIQLPLDKFTSAHSLEMRCVSDGQNLPVPIPERWDVHKITLNLYYTMSNDMISDMSQMVVRFNGEPVAQLKLDQQEPNASAAIQIPVELIEPGDNTITFQVAQHYQTSVCERPCAPELWTSVSLHKSSLQIDYDLKPLPLRLGEAVNLVFDPKQFPEMRVNLVTDSSTQEAVTLAGIVASGIARHLDYRKVRFSHSSDIVPGMDNVLIGTARFADNVLVPYGIRLGPADGGLIKLLHVPKGNGEDDRHALIVVEGNEAAPLRIAAVTFANMSLPYPGTAELHAYEFNMPDVSMYAGRHVLFADRDYTFREMGMPTYSFYGSGKMTHKGIVGNATELSFRLPPDFRIKQNQYAQMVLNFSYSSGLRADSALNILVNDVQVRDIHLDNGDGNFVENAKIDIPTYLFRPGTNTIAFQPNLIQRQVCDAANNDGLFATIYENSTLYFPPMPHFVDMPRLELFALNGFPFTRWPDGYETLVYLPKHDSASIDTALNLLGMISQRNGFPLFGAQVSFAEPTEWPGEMLVVGKVKDIPRSVMDLAPMKMEGVATVPYPVSRGWGSQASVFLSSQKSGLGAGSGVLMEFESPFRKGRSIVLAAAQNEKDLLKLGDALLQPGVQQSMQGDVSLVRLDAPDYELTSLSVGNKYSTGAKGDMPFLSAFMYAHPSVLHTLMIASVIALGGLGYLALRRIRARRTNGEWR